MKDDKIIFKKEFIKESTIESWLGNRCETNDTLIVIITDGMISLQNSRINEVYIIKTEIKK